MSSDSALRDVRRDPHVGRWARRVGLVVLALVVLAGAFGLFGVRSRTTTTRVGAYSLTVTYPQVARAGLDVPWRVHVNYPSAPKSLTIAVTSDYFRMFETQGFYPNPDSQTNDGHFVQFTYQQPPSDGFELEYDAYVQPAEQFGKQAMIKVIVGGHVMVSTHIRTWLVP